MEQFLPSMPHLLTHLNAPNFKQFSHFKISSHSLLFTSLLFLFGTSFHMPILPFNLVLLLLVLAAYYYNSKPNSIYLVDYSCFNPPSTLRGPSAAFLEVSALSGYFDKASMEFQKMIVERSRIGEETALPESLHYIPPKTTLSAAWKETETVIFGALDNLFFTTKVQPKSISVLVVNCSLFTPIPSLCSVIVNRYKMRSSIKSFNLSGMGCSAGLISIAAARDLLQVHNNTYALVVSTENITLNWYFGNQRSMLLSNCLFRVGGAAVLLSNKRPDKQRSKYQLLHVVRTHMAADDKAYGCVFQEPDGHGKVGVRLSKDLITIAGNSLKANIRNIGPLVLPYSEQLAFLANMLTRKFMNPAVRPYIPNFKRAFEHFCIHAGGRAVIDELEKSLRLSAQDVEASRMSLHKFGNTSASSIWYELAYIEAKGRMKMGDRVWQVAFGSGFKCHSAVWKAVGKMVGDMGNNPWRDWVTDYPINVA